MEKNRFKPYCAVYLILIKNDQILFHKRKNSGYQDGKHSLVAGHLEGSETAKQTIIREAKEEADITLNPDNLKEVHVMHRILKGGREYIDIYVQANEWEGEIKNMEPEKCIELCWLPESNFPSSVLPEVKFALKNVHNNIFYSDYKA
ncbi:NUDIX domain-containing protein [Candidatus Parcubacteria bacterium]|nr:NUDIX domain-containing protein [Candidatus Parcubacteria bacterium]